MRFRARSPRIEPVVTLRDVHDPVSVEQTHEPWIPICLVTALHAMFVGPVIEGCRKPLQKQLYQGPVEIVTEGVAVAAQDAFDKGISPFGISLMNSVVSPPRFVGATPS